MLNTEMDIDRCVHSKSEKELAYLAAKACQRFSELGFEMNDNDEPESWDLVAISWIVLNKHTAANTIGYIVRALGSRTINANNVLKTALERSAK